MLAAILKVSSRLGRGGANLVGGTAGTAFSLSNKRCVTCNHVVNDDLFKNPVGFAATRVVFVFEDGRVVNIERSHVQRFPDKDVSIVSHPDLPAGKWELDINPHSNQETVTALGYYANKWPPNMAINTDITPALIEKADASTLLIRTTGVIMESREATVNAHDIKVKDLDIYQISAAVFVGMSGGPLLSADNKIIGLLSFGLPADEIFKTQRFAVWSGAWSQLAGL